jgi:hypothetical protein
MSRKQQQQKAARAQTHRPHTAQACKWTATASKNLSGRAIRAQPESLTSPTRPQSQSFPIHVTVAPTQPYAELAKCLPHKGRLTRRDEAWGCAGATGSCIGWHWDCGLVGLARDSSRALTARPLRCFDDVDACVLACVGYALCVCALAASWCCCSSF